VSEFWSGASGKEKRNKKLWRKKTMWKRGDSVMVGNRKRARKKIQTFHSAHPEKTCKVVDKKKEPNEPKRSWGDGGGRTGGYFQKERDYVRIRDR